MAAKKKTTTRKKATRRPRTTDSPTAIEAGAPVVAEVVEVPPPIVEAVSKPSAISVTQAAPAPIPTPPKQAIKKVMLRNTMGQLLIASVVDDAGVAQEIRILPRESYGPVPEANLTGHTLRLVSLGHLKLLPPTR